MNENHPLFDKSAADRRWTGKLVDLLPELRRRALKLGALANSPKDEFERREGDKDFAWVVLPRGAVVGFRVRGDLAMRGELRLARADEPSDMRLWVNECAVFLKHFGIQLLDGKTVCDADGQWIMQEPNARDEGRVASRYMELRIGEVRPGYVNCPMCAQAGFVTACAANDSVLGRECPQHGWMNLSKANDAAERQRGMGAISR